MKTVILASGFGSRLWPLSTSESPKQFQALVGEESLLQYTYLLLQKVTATADLYVLTLQGLESTVQTQLPGISPENIITVPGRRNTLPHTMFALRQLAESPQEQIVFSTVDHYITQPEEFIASLTDAIKSTEESDLITLLCTEQSGYDPNAGYAQTTPGGRVQQYKEKPSPEAVKEMSGAGNTYRDTAIFIASKKSMLHATKALDRELANKAETLLEAPDERAHESFLELPFTDIATGLFEKADNLRVTRIDGDFTDVGRYQALYDITPKDKQGNVVVGHAIVKDCANCLVINRTDKPMVVLNAKDSVIVQAAGGMLNATFADVDMIGEVYKTQIHK